MERVVSQALFYILPAAWAKFLVHQCVKGKEVLPSLSTLWRYKLTLHVSWMRYCCSQTLQTMGPGLSMHTLDFFWLGLVCACVYVTVQ